MATFTITLKAARVNAHKNLEDAAQHLGVTKRTILNWENGTTVPDHDLAAKLADFYEIDISYIFFGRNIAKSEINRLKRVRNDSTG